MKKLLLAALLLFSSPALAQNVFFPANPGDMIVKGTVGAWTGVPGGTAGCVLMSQGPTAAPTWQCALPLNFGLPPIATNRVFGNVSGTQAPAIPITINQFLDTIGYDTLRTPTNGSMIYKDPATGTWQALVSPPVSGLNITSAGPGQAPIWAPAGAIAAPGIAGTCLTSNGVAVAPTYQTCTDSSAFHPGGNTGIPYFAAGVPSYVSAGTTTTVLHGNASGIPSYGAVVLSTDVSGNLPVARLNSGTSASATTFWNGSGAWLSALTSVICNGGTTTITTSGTCGSRELLTSARTYFVLTTGNDTNCSGLVNAADPGSGALPRPCGFRSIQKGINVVATTLDLGGQGANISVANGSGASDYTTPVVIAGPWTGFGTVSIVGNTGTPSNVLINVTGTCFDISGGAVISISGLKTQCATNAFFVTNGGFANLTAIEFGTSGANIFLAYNATVFTFGNFTVSGSAGWIFHNTQLSYLNVGTGVWTMSGTPAFGSFTFGTSENSVSAFFNTWSGAATGRRAFIHQGSLVTASGGTVLPDAFFPGNAASTFFGASQFNETMPGYNMAPLAGVGTPAAGIATVHIDPTSKALCDKDDAGALHCTYVAGQYTGVSSNTVASAGNIGEFVSNTLATGSATALTSLTAKTIASVSLTAGEWDVTGVIDYIAAATTTVRSLYCFISQTNNTTDGTLGNWTSIFYASAGTTVLNTSDAVLGCPVVRKSFSGTTTVYIVALTEFGTSTMSGAGFIRATRVH